MSDTYVYTGTNVLINKLNIRDSKKLDKIERYAATQRELEGVPVGNFDLPHLKSIHHHLFQDVYEWAGEIRTVSISKGQTVFQFPSFIERGVAYVHNQLEQRDFLKGLSPEEFAAEAAEIVSDLNYAHPFREGNGRTQLLYLEQLAEQAGHSLDIAELRTHGWIEASIAAQNQNFEPMQLAIEDAIRSPDREQDYEP